MWAHRSEFYCDWQSRESNIIPLQTGSTGTHDVLSYAVEKVDASLLHHSGACLVVFHLNHTQKLWFMPSWQANQEYLVMLGSIFIPLICYREFSSTVSFTILTVKKTHNFRTSQMNMESRLADWSHLLSIKATEGLGCQLVKIWVAQRYRERCYKSCQSFNHLNLSCQLDGKCKWLLWSWV